MNKASKKAEGFHPKVSIVIPVYNGSNYLAEAIDSALAQTYKNIEVIVVNDGSTDGGKTEEIAKSYGDRLRYFYKENGGVASALNLGIREMAGEYFSWLSHDDMYLPDKLEKQINCILRHNKDDKLLLYSDFKGFDERNRSSIICRVAQATSKQEIYNTLILLFRGNIHGCTLLLPKSCFAEVGLFNEEQRTTQDYEMWFKLLKNGYKFVHMPEVLILTRWHEEQGTLSMSDIHFREVESLYSWAFDLFHENFKSFSYAELNSIIVSLRNRTLTKSPDYIFKTWQESRQFPLMSALIIMIGRGWNKFNNMDTAFLKLYKITPDFVKKSLRYCLDILKNLNFNKE